VREQLAAVAQTDAHQPWIAEPVTSEEDIHDALQEQNKARREEIRKKPLGWMQLLRKDLSSFVSTVLEKTGSSTGDDWRG
jgi:hypothetical protein